MTAKALDLQLAPGLGFEADVQPNGEGVDGLHVPGSFR
jgi:hypothetical protein